MLLAVGLQIVTIALACLVSGISFDWVSAKFVALGGAAAIIPNGLLALRLTFHRGRPPESYPVVFFLGEFVKIGLTVGLLAWIIKSVDGIRWLPLLIGLILALKVPLFALAFPGARESGTTEGSQSAGNGAGA